MDIEASASLSYLEWELSPPKVLISEHGPIDTVFSEILITRDSEYDLSAELKGHISQGTMRGSPPAGTVTSGGESRGHTEDGRPVTLTGVVQGSSARKGTGEVSASAIVGRVGIGDIQLNRAVWLSVWCLNGSDSIHYPRGTERIRKGEIYRARRRSGGIAGTELTLPGDFASSSSSDYFELKNAYFHLRFCLAPVGIGPSWSRNSAIEILSNPYDVIPSEAPKEIVNALGYFLGRRLIPIGCTWFAEDGTPMGSESFRPWTWDAKRTCEHPDAPPVRLCTPFLNEALLSDLVVRFLDSYEELDFSHVMWNYWLAIMSPPDAAIGHFSTVLETVMNAWFRSKRSKSQGQYMPTSDFTALTRSAFSSIEAGLGVNPDKERILSRLKRANSLGANEKLAKFLNELKLPISDVEKHVMRIRNRIVHGSSGSSDGHALVHNMRAYRAFVNRVILKCLGYTGSYIDYSSSGFPERTIDDPLGGPAGDQRPAEI